MDSGTGFCRTMLCNCLYQEIYRSRARFFMQGHSSPVESMPLTLGIDHASSNQHIQEQLYRNLTDHLVSSSSNTSVSYINHAGQGRSHLNIGGPCEFSSSNSDVQNAHNGNKVVHACTDSLTIDREGHDVAVRFVHLENRDINLNSNANDTGLTSSRSRSQVREPDFNQSLGRDISFHPNPGHPEATCSTSSGGSLIPCANPSDGLSDNDDDNTRIGCALDCQRLSHKRKIIGGSDDMSSTNGSSSYQNEIGFFSESLTSNMNMHVSDGNVVSPSASNVELDQSSGNTVVRLCCELQPLMSTEHTDNLIRSTRMRSIPANGEDAFLFNSLFSGNDSIHPGIRPSHPSATSLVPLSQELGSRPVDQASTHGQSQSIGSRPEVPMYVSQSPSQSQPSRPAEGAPTFRIRRSLVSTPAVSMTEPLLNIPQLDFSPSQPQNVHTVEWSGVSSLRLPRSYGYSNSSERSSALRQEINLIEQANLLRRNTSNSVPNYTNLVPPVEHPSMTTSNLEQFINWNMSSRNMHIHGNDASASQAGANSAIHPSLGSRSLPRQNLPMELTQVNTNVVCPPVHTFVPTRLVSPSHNFVLPRNDSSAHSQDSGNQPVANSHVAQQRIQRPRAILERQINRYATISGPLRSFSGGTALSEIQGAIHFLCQQDGLRHEDAIPLNRSIVLDAADRHDRYRDMRLDVDNMSYEELLALEERIGNVNTGLKEETILKHLKQKKYSLCVSAEDSSVEPCCICQEEYIEGVDLGTLRCGHEFHGSCIKQWLMQKNACPVCKEAAIST